ncbi:MAG TPA: hypothetical protein VKD91_13210, partial [Pyrinomonadaceae bacterium]|nr:hypothetical protein [Pyrinomonadaceae bacterium]
MADWLRYIAMIFYAPLRGIREVRDRGTLGAAVVTAFVIQIVYSFLLQLLAGDRAMLRPGASALGTVFFQAVAPILTIAIVLVPVLILVANLFDRRGSFGVVLQQEYGSLASVSFYVFSATCLLTLLIAAILHFSGFQAAYVAAAAQSQDTEQMRATIEWFKLSPAQVALLKAQINDAVYVSKSLFRTFQIPLLAVGGVVAVRVVFRTSIVRAIAILLIAGLASLPLSRILYPLFGHIIGSPFLLIFVFFLLRGYFTEIVSNQRARAAFKQNLEAATINPRDSSAHYN